MGGGGAKLEGNAKKNRFVWCFFFQKDLAYDAKS